MIRIQVAYFQNHSTVVGHLSYSKMGLELHSHKKGKIQLIFLQMAH